MFKKLFVLFFISIISSACAFSDNFPDWKDIKAYKASGFELGKTTLEDFIKLYPDATTKEAGKNIKTINLSTKETDFFKKVRVGFNEEKLDWIEFTFAKNFKIKDLINIYGKPDSVNKAYSNIFDYYNYGLFNAAVEKSTDNIINITLFSILPDKNGESLNLGHFKGLKPGITTEIEIKDNPKFSNPNKIKKADNSAVYAYTVADKTISANKVELNFDNGLLSWINISVSSLNLDKALKIYGKNYTIKALNSKYDLYDFKNTVLTVDKKAKKVINIGVL